VRGLEESYNTLQALTDCPAFTDGNEQSFAPNVLEALCDDLNTPKAIAELHALHRDGNLAALGPTLRALGFSRRPESQRAIDKDKVVALVDARNAARKAKNFKEADRIRDELKANGIELEDKKDGTTVWKVMR
jgi:cysteinyl-tRNA synthetase